MQTCAGPEHLAFVHMQPQLVACVTCMFELPFVAPAAASSNGVQLGVCRHMAKVRIDKPDLASMQSVPS